MSTKFSHLEINVSDYAKSIRFYDSVLRPLGWERLVCSEECATYSDGFMKIILSPTHSKYLHFSFHRKRVGLNHIALQAGSKEEVDSFFKNTMLPQNIPSLYQEGPAGDDHYYSVLFEDPDRMKLELVFAPKYCDKNQWPNNLPSDFDPYKSTL